MLRICVVGAGITGSLLTRLLARCGHEVVLVERRSGPAGGAGIVLTPRAVDSLAAAGVRPEMLRLDRGMSIATGSGRPLLGSGARSALRRDRLAAALEHGLDGLADVRRGVALEQLEVGPYGVRCGIAGEELAVDLVIGADGLRSTVRRLVEPAAGVRSAGQRCWRTLVPARLSGRAIEAWHGGRRVGVVPLPHGESYLYAVAREDRGPRPLSPAGFSGVPAAALALLAEGTDQQGHDLREVTRVVWGSDRAVLVGDASHGMLPNLGVGAALGIADAVALVAELDRGVPGLAARLARRRTPTVRSARDASRALGAVAHLRPLSSAPLR